MKGYLPPTRTKTSFFLWPTFMSNPDRSFLVLGAMWSPSLTTRNGGGEVILNCKVTRPYLRVVTLPELDVLWSWQDNIPGVLCYLASGEWSWTTLEYPSRLKRSYDKAINASD